MKTKHILTSDEKLTYWGYGEWVEEPDLVEFEHKGIHCRVERCSAAESNGSIFGGHLCGYICIPKDHPWNELGWDNIFSLENPPQVHGGLTYFSSEGTDFWIGFDCAHSGDFVPSLESLKKEMMKIDSRYRKMKEEEEALFSQLSIKRRFFENTYRNISFVINECKSLAEQVLNISEIKTNG